ncbi:UNVERIFIED_CONTAM: hypothetical protein FKN15_058541 [Acipenser sinensis]
MQKGKALGLNRHWNISLKFGITSLKVIDLLWARDGEQWEAWEQQHRPVSLLDIAAMVFNNLAADMGGAPPSPVPSGGATSIPPRQGASDRGRATPVPSN